MQAIATIAMMQPAMSQVGRLDRVGALGAAGNPTDDSTDLPHALQNRASAEIGAPQCLQNLVCSLIYLSSEIDNRTVPALRVYYRAITRKSKPRADHTSARGKFGSSVY
jgi:hypothetical protein